MRLGPALVVVAVLLAGCAGGPAGDSLQVSERWTAGSSSVEGNHHAIGAGHTEDGGVVAIPLGGRRGKVGCKLLVVNGSGAERWTAQIPKEACTIHAVADPAVADFVGGPDPEVIASTTEERVVAHDPQTGDPVFSFQLTDYGYTRPVVADVVGDGAPELVVTDIDGTLFVVRQNGTAVVNRSLDAYSWGAPAVADFDGTGDTEIVLGLGNGSVLAFDHRGDLAWRAGVAGAVTWTADGDIDDDPAREFVAATAAGTVTAIDGATGDPQWARDFGKLAAVHSVADGDGDGTVEVYATAKDGTLRALSGPSGETEWETPLTNASVQMMPPPVVGDVTGDGTPEVVAVTHDGYVRVVDPANGAVLGSYHRDVAVYTHVTLADTDGDGVQEVYVMYGDGRAVALRVGS